MILVISVYVPPVDVNALSLAIDLIKSAVRRHGQGHELIIAGDFNRHDQLWGGDEVDSSVRQGEAAAIIEMMMDLDLQSLLPRGTKTYEGRAGESTIDLILATAELVASRVMCQPYQTEHRSDHLAISTTFALKVETSTSLQPRRVFKKADLETDKNGGRTADRPPAAYDCRAQDRLASDTVDFGGGVSDQHSRSHRQTVAVCTKDGGHATSRTFEMNTRFDETEQERHGEQGAGMIN